MSIDTMSKAALRGREAHTAQQGIIFDSLLAGDGQWSEGWSDSLSVEQQRMLGSHRKLMEYATKYGLQDLVEVKSRTEEIN